jgi:Ca2+-binding RTX toxin-like protein
LLDGGRELATVFYCNCTPGASFDVPGPVELDLNLTHGGATGLGNDTLIRITHAQTTEAADTVIGNQLRNILFSNAGNDTIYAKAGDDFLDGAEGDDTIYGNMLETTSWRATLTMTPSTAA